MQLNIGKIGDVTVVAVQDEHLDASVTEEFKRDMAPVLEDNAKVVLDMSWLQFVDSAGLGAILSCLRKLGAMNGDLKLCGLTKPVRSMFEMARMHRIFDIFPTCEEAVQAFQSG